MTSIRTVIIPPMEDTSALKQNTFVSVETQNGSLILSFEPEAETFVLDRNGADTGWEFINWEFEDRVYTSAIIQDNELIITSTESWRYDGTYIQLPDIGTDGEGNKNVC